MFTKQMLKSALASVVVIAAIKNFAPASVKKYL